jgi:hypothetical protein
MTFKVSFEADSLDDLRLKILELQKGLDDKSLNFAGVARKLRLTFNDMCDLFTEYEEVTGNDRSVIMLPIANEVRLLDIPIDLWWTVARSAQNAINEKKNEVEFDEMLKELAW